MILNNLFDLKGKIALITGSSQGLGNAMAKGLGLAGASVILNGRDKIKLEKAVNEMKKEGINAEGYSFDVKKRDEIDKSISLIEKEIGSIDILVNNSGIQRRSLLVEMDESTWKDVIDTNLNSVFLVSQRVVKGMITKKAGKIINICSLMSEVGRATIAPYTASKGGLKVLTKTMCVEWAQYNIQVNGIGPGYFITEMNTALIEDTEFNNWVISRTPAGRWADPSELMGTTVFLASPASNFVNGQIIYVDGGILASI